MNLYKDSSGNLLRVVHDRYSLCHNVTLTWGRKKVQAMLLRLLQSLFFYDFYCLLLFRKLINKIISTGFLLHAYLQSPEFLIAFGKRYTAIAAMSIIFISPVGRVSICKQTYCQANLNQSFLWLQEELNCIMQIQTTKLAAGLPGLPL